MSLEGGREGRGGEGEGRGGEGSPLVILAIFFLNISVARYYITSLKVRILLDIAKTRVVNM